MTTRIANVDTNIVFSWCVTHLSFSLCVCVCVCVQVCLTGGERQSGGEELTATQKVKQQTALQVEQGFLEGISSPQSPLFQLPVSNCQFPIGKCPRGLYTDT